MTNLYTSPGSYTLVVPAETDYTITAIGGGGGGAYNGRKIGAAGIASTVTSSDHAVNLTAAGGAGGAASGTKTSGIQVGASPGNYIDTNGVVYVGGATADGGLTATTAGNSPGGGGGGQKALFAWWAGGAAGTWASGSYTNATGNSVTLTITVGVGGLGGNSKTVRGGAGMVSVTLIPLPLPGTPNTLPSHGALSATCAAKKFIFTAHITGHGALAAKYPGTGLIFAQETAPLSGVGQFASSNTYAKFFVSPQLGASGALAGIITNDIIFFPVTGSFFVVADPSITGVLNEPIVAPVNATVTFTPRLPPGTLIPLGQYLVTPAFNALQQVFLINNPTSGTWTLQFGSAITGPLAYDINPADLKTALGALDTIGGAGNINVSEGVSADSYDVEFIQHLGNRYMPPMIANADLLSNVEGPGFCEATVAVNLLGSPMVIDDTSTVIAVIAAQIHDGQLCTTDYVNTPGLQLVANSSQLALDQDLIYDVDFTNITFNGVSNPDIIAPFAFTAPTNPDLICITDPSLPKLPYKPIKQTPPFNNSDAGPVAMRKPKSMMRLGWRERALLDMQKTPVRRPARATVPKRNGR